MAYVVKYASAVLTLSIFCASGAVLAADTSTAPRQTRHEVAQQYHLSDNVSPRVLSIAIDLDLVRKLMELYRIQHGDKGPRMENMTCWQALIGKSRSDGTPSNDFGDVGPYLEQLPVNPYTNSSRVVRTAHPDAGAGWTYDEKSWRIRAIVPEASLKEAAELPVDDFEVLSPKGAALASVLQIVTVQTIDYKLMHGRYPTMQEMSDWNALLTMGPESKIGQITHKSPRRITAAPRNVITGSSRIVAAGRAAPDVGWTYDENTGAFRAVVTVAEQKHVNELSPKQYELIAQAAEVTPR